MNRAIYAADECFAGWGETWNPARRVELLRSLGYAGTSLTLNTGDARGQPASCRADADDVRDYLGRLDAAGLRLFALRWTADVHTGEIDSRLEAAMRAAGERGVVLDLALASSGAHDEPSASRADPRAVALVRQVADLGRRHGVRVSLCPLAGRWLQRTEDAVRLGMRLNRADVGLTFNCFDWFAVDGRDLGATLQLALPRLCHLTLCGASRAGNGSLAVEPLDAGELDAAGAVRIAAGLGYTGPIGLAGIGLGQEVETSLRRSMAAWRALIAGGSRVGAKSVGTYSGG
jgi:sugar phosphate isomerase/epimerase